MKFGRTSAPAVFIVVLSLTDLEESRIDDWLQSVEFYARDVPILMVGTHSGNPISTEEFINKIITSLKNKYLGQYQYRVIDSRLCQLRETQSTCCQIVYLSDMRKFFKYLLFPMFLNELSSETKRNAHFSRKFSPFTGE